MTPGRCAVRPPLVEGRGLLRAVGARAADPYPLRRSPRQRSIPHPVHARRRQHTTTRRPAGGLRAARRRRRRRASRLPSRRYPIARAPRPSPEREIRLCHRRGRGQAKEFKRTSVRAASPSHEGAKPVPAVAREHAGRSRSLCGRKLVRRVSIAILDASACCGGNRSFSPRGRGETARLRAARSECRGLVVGASAAIMSSSKRTQPSTLRSTPGWWHFGRPQVVDSWVSARELLACCDLHGCPQDAGSLPRQTLRCLSQQFYARVR